MCDTIHHAQHVRSQQEIRPSRPGTLLSLAQQSLLTTAFLILQCEKIYHTFIASNSINLTNFVAQNCMTHISASAVGKITSPWPAGLGNSAQKLKEMERLFFPGQTGLSTFSIVASRLQYLFSLRDGVRPTPHGHGATMRVDAKGTSRCKEKD